MKRLIAPLISIAVLNLASPAFCDGPVAVFHDIKILVAKETSIPKEKQNEFSKKVLVLGMTEKGLFNLIKETKLVYRDGASTKLPKIIDYMLQDSDGEKKRLLIACEDNDRTVIDRTLARLSNHREIPQRAASVQSNPVSDMASLNAFLKRPMKTKEGAELLENLGKDLQSSDSKKATAAKLNLARFMKLLSVADKETPKALLKTDADATERKDLHNMAIEAVEYSMVHHGINLSPSDAKTYEIQVILIIDGGFVKEQPQLMRAVIQGFHRSAKDGTF